MVRMERKKEDRALDESLRRLGGILASPSLVMSYEHTTPRVERAWLRRIGLTRAEAAQFLERMCEHGALDGGAKPLVASVCARRGVPPREAARLLLAGECWDEDTE